MAVTVGLDIAATAVRAAVVKSGKGLPRLESYGEVALPEGAVVNGEIVDESVVTDAILRLFKEYKIPKKRVVVGLANQRVIVRQIALPYMDVAELEESLEFQAQEYIPIPIDEAILDFVPIEEFATPEGEAMMSVLIIAAQREMANELLRVCAGAGIKPIAFDLQAFALVAPRRVARSTSIPEPKPWSTSVPISRRSSWSKEERFGSFGSFRWVGTTSREC